MAYTSPEYKLVFLHDPLRYKCNSPSGHCEHKKLQGVGER